MPKTRAQQAIRDVNRLAARGEITPAEAKCLTAQAKQAEQERVLRAALDVVAARTARR